MNYLRFFLFFPLFFSTAIVIAQEQVTAPGEFFGYEIGEHFTPHHRIKEYFEQVSKETGKAKLIRYGSSYEGRPLMVMVVSSEKNINRIDSIRINNLRKTGLVEGEFDKNDRVIVWLSYGVHGNESSSTEAALLTLHELLSENDLKVKQWLDKVVVIIDPCINPDGRERYIQWYRQYRSTMLIPDPEDIQHHEPWPGGRMNHYLFDLNRDWAWATQKETRDRLKLYNEWMPHIHVDFHEQGINNPYYFAPAAKPYHDLITEWQEKFQVEIGKNNARYFDRNQWLYFTGERFDLFYPGYGDTYPIFNGAIGMTYEQAGGGAAGVGVITEVRDTLTLKERVRHHFTTGMATIETASVHAEELDKNFIEYFNVDKPDPGRPDPDKTQKTFIIRSDNSSQKIRKLLELLDRHKVSYGTTSNTLTVTGFDYHQKKNVTYTLGEKDILIPSRQPKSVLTRVLFEPYSVPEDSLTYDITAWSVPYAFGIKTMAVDRDVPIITKGYSPDPVSVKDLDSAYAWAFGREAVPDMSFLSGLLERKIRVRTNLEKLVNDSVEFDPGSLFVLSGDNRQYKGDLDEKITSLAGSFEIPVYQLGSGMSESGPDLGSPKLEIISPPKVAMLFGGGVSPYNAGEIWHMFEQETGYPLIRLESRNFSGDGLSETDVLIIPHGYYSKVFDEETIRDINKWVREGGRLILIGHALSYFSGKEGYGLKKYLDEEEKKELEEMEEEENYLKRYEERERLNLKDMISGGIFKVKLDNSHPLGFGYPGYYFTLKNLEERYAMLEKGWNVGVIESSGDLVSGFAGSNTGSKTFKSLVTGMEELGKGEVVYFVDNPVFRAFWENGKLMLLNAVFMP